MTREYDREDASFEDLLDPYVPVKHNRVNVDAVAQGERESADSYRQSTKGLLLSTIRKNLKDWDSEARGVWKGANLDDLIARAEKAEEGDLPPVLTRIACSRCVVPCVLMFAMGSRCTCG